jgi:outer membrane lipoprotein
MKRLVVAFGISLLVQGCTYAISPEMVDQSDNTLTFRQLQADPDTFKGKIIILGGIIVQTSTTKHATIIEIVERPLDYWGKPKRTNKTEGRFLVVHNGYLDPMLFSPGSAITVAAEIEGTRGKSLGEIDYSYPVVVSKELKLWPRERQSWDRPQWIDPLYDPYSPARHEW